MKEDTKISFQWHFNSRPLTVPSSDPDDLDPLTPNHLLTMKSKMVMPPLGNFQKADVYLRKRWKRVQYLSNIFWSRWKKELTATTYQVEPTQKKPGERRPSPHCGRSFTEKLLDHARVLNTYPDSEGQVRSARITTGSTTLDRQ